LQTNLFKKYFFLNLSNRRDFRLVIGDPNNPGRAIPNPVIWFRDFVVMEVNYLDII
jgi:hypothetical protein